MSLATLRAMADTLIFSADQLGESVTFTPRETGTARTIVALVEAYAPNWTGKRQQGRPHQAAISDGMEYLRVTVSRDESSASGGIAQEPSLGSMIVRSSTRDSDTRPFAYVGTELAKEAKHAVYLFGRDKRPSDTRRTAQA